MSIITTLSLVLTAAAWAQTRTLPADLANLPEEIKTLKWQTIDPAALTPLEQSRALLLLDHALNELSANATSEADLMSTYIEKQNLGAQFASTPPPPAPKELSYDDAMKVSVALLRGPMNKSYYATELADASPGTLASYAQMYQRTCRRRWSEFDEARHQVRCMASFLGNNQKLQDYDGWATAESALRQKQFDAAKPGQPAQAPTQTAALQQQNQQLRQALGAAEYQQAQTQQAAPAQQQTADAQQQSAQAQQAAYVSGVPVYGGIYGGYGAYGAAAAGAYAGANAANNPNTAAKTAAAGQYHAADSTWNKNSSYSSAARSQTEDRMSSFHGASPTRAGAGRR
jgi:hypothetical protein